MEEDTRSKRLKTRRRARLRRLGNCLLTVAVASAAYPWLTGAYTWAQQRLMEAAFEYAPAPAAVPPRGAGQPRLARGPKMEMAGWQAEDGAYWRGLDPGEQFGRLAIPSAGVDIIAVKGVSKGDLKRGPGWLPDTALPGEVGNVGMSGHRTTYLAPFRRLDRVSLGDRIELRSPYRLYVYRVVDQWTVSPEGGHVMAPTSEAMLTLTTCHPPYSDRRRLVVRARLESVTRIERSVSDQGE